MKLALFGDGCSAAVFRNEDLMAVKECENGQWVVENYTSKLVDETSDVVKMFWNNSGQFDSTISHKLPNIVKEGVHGFVEGMLEEQGLGVADVDGWAVHPGGAKILGSVQKALGLQEDKLTESYNILKNYGNMASPSVWFVLDQLLKKETNQSMEHVLALAFGPGISMEGVLMKKYCHF